MTAGSAVAGGMRTALGLMSGTSMDGIDVALLVTDGERIGRIGPAATRPYAAPLRRRLADTVAAPDTTPAAELAALEAALTDAHAEAVLGFLDAHALAPAAIDLAGFHGHTLLHRPERRFTRQLGDGARLAARLGVDVINDFRAADVAAGGQGAPLAPLFHRALAAGLEPPLAVLNLGGVGNVTYLDGETVLAFDTGPGNALIDDWMAQHGGRPCDLGGALAAQGRVDAACLAALLDHPYFALRPPKSLDRNAFPVAAVSGLAAADGAATLTAFTAAAVARAVAHLPRRPRRWLVTGGGRHNRTLMAWLGERLGVPVAPVEAVGWDGDALEAQAFAYLAVRALRGLPLSLPATTGVPQPLTGGVLHRAGRS